MDGESTFQIGEISQDSQPHKTWCFTDFVLENVAMYAGWQGDVSRMVVSQEVCPDTGRPHLQGRITFKIAKRFAAVTKLVPCHWEAAKVSCFIYEQKAGSEVLINVDNRAQGAHTEIQNAMEAIKDGRGKRYMAQWHPAWYCKYGNKFDELREHLYKPIKTGLIKEGHEIWYEKPDLEAIKEERVIVWIGPSGIGKSTAAKQWLVGYNYLLVKEPDDLKKFDDEIHNAILFDDFSPLEMTREQKLTIFEQVDECSIHCRYANATIPAGTIKIILCNDAWWPAFDPAFERRTFEYKTVVAIRNTAGAGGR